MFYKSIEQGYIYIKKMELDEYKNDYKMFCEKADNYLEQDSFKEAITFYKKAINSIQLLIISIKNMHKEIEFEDDGDFELKTKLDNCLIINDPKIKWNSIAGLEKAKQILNETVILPIQFPLLFDGKRQPTKCILLYGPSGTGKSYLANALATESNIPFFSVSSVDIISKYSGESEKLIKTLFALARKKKPSIIFFDQIDSILRTSTYEVTQSIVNEFMQQMKEVNKNDKNIFVLATINFPWELNSLALNLFQKKIYIGLPGFEERKQLFKINLADIKNDLNDEQLDTLSQLTEGFSGSDIDNLTQETLFEPLRKCCNTPSSNEDKGKEEKALKEIANNKDIKSRIVTFDDFVHSLETTKQNVTKDDLKRYTDFTEKFGIKG